MTLTPTLSQAIAAGNTAAIRRIRRLWLVVAASAALVGVTFFYLLRDPIIAVLLSHEYSSAADLLVGLAIAAALLNMGNIVNWFLTTLGDSRSVLTSNGIGCIATLSLTLVLCPILGLSGAVWAMIVGYTMQLAASTLMYRYCDANRRNILRVVASASDPGEGNR